MKVHLGLYCSTIIVEKACCGHVHVPHHGGEKVLFCQVLLMSCSAFLWTALPVGGGVLGGALGYFPKNMIIWGLLNIGVLWALTCILPTGLPKVRFLCGVTNVVRLERWVIKAPGGIYLSRQQLPLKLAWAISIHKSQVSDSSSSLSSTRSRAP